ncbi:hypothetical protein, partial [Neisseria gonorrhoeae]|uniref:hypothetical protein n=1 Tax=Neisseria gonorrhoeae TaxID=485 RepID=UPI0030DC1CF8
IPTSVGMTVRLRSDNTVVSKPVRQHRNLETRHSRQYRNLQIRHSRAGGNLDLSVQELIGQNGFLRF